MFTDSQGYLPSNPAPPKPILRKNVRPARAPRRGSDEANKRDADGRTTNNPTTEGLDHLKKMYRPLPRNSAA